MPSFEELLSYAIQSSVQILWNIDKRLSDNPLEKAFIWQNVSLQASVLIKVVLDIDMISFPCHMPHENLSLRLCL